MSRSLRRVAALTVTAVALVVASSCSSSSTAPALTPSQMQGTYDLLTFQSNGGATYTPTTVPAATGTLALTLTRYNLTLNIGGAPQVDSGTYTVSGSTFSETSDVTTLTYTGTASISGSGVLNVSVNAAGNLVVTTFQKQ